MNLLARLTYKRNRLLAHFIPYKTWLPAIVFSFSLSTSFSQNIKGDTTTGHLKTMYHQYLLAIGGGANLYSGAEYVASYPQTEGTPFWNGNDFEKGVISYEGVIYYDIPMAFDIVQNAVVIKSFQQLAIRLYAPKVDFFLLAGHTFEHPRTGNDRMLKNVDSDALYDLLYKGTACLYARRTKSVERSLHAENPYLFAMHTDYFLLKDNEYYPVAGKKELLNIFKAESEALKTFWKEGNINFKTSPEGAIVQTLAYRDASKKLN